MNIWEYRHGMPVGYKLVSVVTIDNEHTVTYTIDRIVEVGDVVCAIYSTMVSDEVLKHYEVIDKLDCIANTKFVDLQFDLVEIGNE